MLSDNRQDLMDGALGEGEGRRKCEMGQSSNLYIFTVSAQSSVPSAALAAPGSLLEMQSLRPTPDLLAEIPYLNKISCDLHATRRYRQKFSHNSFL